MTCKCHCPNSPNTAPATKNESHDWSLSHMKRYLQCAEQQQVSLSHITEYCACHAKWLSWLILVTYETLFTMRGTTDGILQHHRILRLPRKLTLETFTKISRKLLKRHLQCATDPSRIRAGSENDPTMIRPWNRHSATRLATEATFHAHHEHFVLKNTTFRAPAIIPNFTEYCACHEKWHFNFTKYCACHAKWLSWSILVTHERLFTMRRGTSVIVQTHQILRLPRKMNLMIDPCHTWNTIYMPRKVTLRYSTLLFSTIRYYSLTNLFHYESNLLRISSQTNLISYESNLLYESLLTRISSHTNLISYESLLKRISSHTNLISYESLLKRI